MIAATVLCRVLVSDLRVGLKGELIRLLREDAEFLVKQRIVEYVPDEPQRVQESGE